MHTTTQTLRLALVAVVCLLVGVAQASAATYYVSPSGSNANPGTSGSPFLTIAKGESVLAAGDTLIIRAGAYAEMIREVDIAATGTSGSPIVIKAAMGETVTLAIAGSDNLIRFQDGTKTYIEIQDIIADGTGGFTSGAGATPVAFGLTSNHITLTRVEVKNGTGTGMLIYGSNHTFTNLLVHGNGTWGGYTISNGFYGAPDSSTINGGSFYDNECYGVRFMDSDVTASADLNVVKNIRAYNNGTGKGLSGTASCGADGGGILMSDVDNQAFNNLVYNNLVGLVAYTGSKTATRPKFWNNTVYGNVVGVQIYAGSSSAEIKNNLLFGNGTAKVISSASTIEANNLTGDPSFTSAGTGDFTLQAGSIAIDAGVTLAGFTADFLNNPRPSGGGYDVGAIEKQLAGGTVTITTPNLPGGQRTAVYGQAISATGGTAPYTYAVTSGALPTGLGLASGVVGGTPTTVGAYGFSITATDSLSVASAPQAYIVSIVDIDAVCTPTTTGSWTIRACPGASSSNGTANAVTPTTTTQSGDVVFCGIGEDKSQTTNTMQDSKSNTWTQFGTIVTAQYGRLTLYRAAMTSFGTLHTFTANTGGNASFPVLQCLVVSGANASPLDVISAGGSTLASQSLQPGRIHPTKTQELIIAAIELEDADTIAVDGAFTSAQRSYSVGKAFGINLAWMVLANPADVNPTFSWTATMDAASSSAALFAVDSVLQSPTMPHRLRIRVH